MKTELLHFYETKLERSDCSYTLKNISKIQLVFEF